MTVCLPWALYQAVALSCGKTINERRATVICFLWTLQASLHQKRIGRIESCVLALHVTLL